MSRGVLPVPPSGRAGDAPGPAGRGDRTAPASDAPTVNFAALAVADTQVLLRPSGPGGPATGLPEPTTAIFVDRSGRRRRLLRWCGAFLAAGCISFATLLGLSMMAGNQTAPGTSIPIDAPSGTAGQHTPSHPAQPSPRRTGTHATTAPTPARSAIHVPVPTHIGTRNA